MSLTLMGVGGGPNVPTGPVTHFRSMIEAISAQASLVLCLDAGESTSYDGSSQTWSDISGSGNHFYRGATSWSESSDPTFNGSAGGLSSSEYFSFDGGDYFIETADHTFAETWHKDNAAFTVVCVHYHVSGNAGAFISTQGASSGAGLGVGATVNISGGAPQLFVRSGSGISYGQAGSNSYTDSSWNFTGVSQNEATGTGGFNVKVNSNTSTHNSSYASPSAGATGGTYKLGARYNTVSEFQASGARLALLAAWNRALSSSELDNLYTQVKTRFTGLP
jgi:hypothetical protein